MSNTTNKVLFVVAISALSLLAVIRLYYFVYPVDDEPVCASSSNLSEDYDDEYGFSEESDEGEVCEAEMFEEAEETRWDYGPGRVALSELTPYKEDNYDCFYYGDSIVDNIGNEHEDIIYILAGTSFANCVAKSYYYIDGKYTKLTGNVFLTESGKNTEYAGKVEFFGDGRSLLCIDNITTGFFPTDFEVDLTGVKELAISIEDPGWDGAYGDRCLSETILYE